MTTGMEGFAQQAGQVDQQAQGLRAAVDSGRLVMDPAAAERVAKLYERKAREVRSERGNVGGLVVQRGFGRCHIGDGLHQKISDKVHGEAGLLMILNKMEENLGKMAQAYRDSAKNVQNAEDENARDLKRKS